MKKLLFIFMSLLSVIYIGNKNAMAEENKTFGGYTVEGIPNNNQIDPNAGYYYLHEEPGEKDVIKIKLINTGNEPKTLKIQLTDADTNENGVITYTDKFESKKNPISKILSIDTNEVTLKPGQTIEKKIDLHTPEERFEGVKLGGIYVTEKRDTSKAKGFSLENTYSYTIGVAISNSSENKIKNNIDVSLGKIDTNLNDGRKVVQANLENTYPYIFGEAEVTTKITKKGNDKFKKESKIESAKIAPNTILPVRVDWGKDEVTPGKYLLEMKISTKEKDWKFKKEFEIKEKVAKDLNENTVFKVRMPKWYIQVRIILLVLLICLTLLSIWNLKKGESHEK
ncbi:DUF916 and DUF3324 domain-containing protein [Enterococcus faecalis]|uniref:DUF916 and DUF3324 domain-containing protein n=1 Tax=Enterococcus faecalis TaxID=1351 RepID=UPI001782EDA1|nr:DUF916 and DUF3324 domain-containing protein [Enterococcus faecalis]MBD9891335.1 DUF916 and DUF3324 domain-containing protein [Enterococcus faecalis]